MADRVVNPRLTVLNESDAEDGLPRRLVSPRIEYASIDERT